MSSAGCFLAPSRCSPEPSGWTGREGPTIDLMKDGRDKPASKSAERPVLIMVTAGGRNDAERIGEGLVEGRLAACCTVIPMVHSFYYEDGQLKREHESLLLIKTVESRSQAVQEYVRANHSIRGPRNPPDCDRKRQSGLHSVACRSSVGTVNRPAFEHLDSGVEWLRKLIVLMLIRVAPEVGGDVPAAGPLPRRD